MLRFGGLNIYEDFHSSLFYCALLFMYGAHSSLAWRRPPLLMGQDRGIFSDCPGVCVGVVYVKTRIFFT